ncbi:unnamed protein product [Chilo suppressalis]|uniref:C2H2-type domain-containing protein n=1 Tax=Chilo suppressalis TaxID=168631 RepID=A0ABN8BA20_CHISP|nr:unnamed protein product [Chilo suppressalis]
MACKTSFELHHNFPKIADEAGFTFNTHRPRIRIDWNKIRLIDVENLIRERKFVFIEQRLNDILDCILESEFDVRILDEGVLKMFRLAQLTVEYQQFCRHYLDRSVYVLREEINSLARELDATKKELNEKDEEIRKIKRKSKHTYRTTLPYGNDNIANMILKTLTNKSDIFHTSNPGASIQYNKCSYCDKVFMNQLYLQSHISRRHAQVMEVPQKDFDENTKNTAHSIENNKLREEVSELKDKLKEMEAIVKNFNNKQEITVPLNHNNNYSITQQTSLETDNKQRKDAEVSTSNEVNLIDRIEEWKKEEQDKYNKEINLLRNQIMETIQALKEKDIPISQSSNNELKIIEQLNITINKQGSEILALKQELINSRLKIEEEESERRKENEAQMLQLASRAESSTKQYELLLHKLNEVAQEARESRAQAEAERTRVEHLEKILQNNLMNRSTNEIRANDNKMPPVSVEKTKEIIKQKLPAKKSLGNPSPEASRQALEKLHQKAQALLNVQSSGSSSDISSVGKNLYSLKVGFNKHENLSQDHRSHDSKKEDKINRTIRKKDKISNHILMQSKNSQEDKTKEQKTKKRKISNSVPNATKLGKNGPVVPPRSPMKVLRAKITEEVNSRLISAGIDPLKSGLSKDSYKKQRMKLQQHVELKAKKNPSHEKIRHSILTYLDSNLPKKATTESQEYISPNKTSRSFSISSVLSNVKNKALSLVKSNDVNGKDKRKSINDEVAKRAMTLLNTPPDSIHSSPDSQKRHTTTQSEYNHKSELKRINHFTPKKIPKTMVTDMHNKEMNDSSPHSTITNDDQSDTDSKESDHKYYKAIVQENQISKSIENLIKSPARRPVSASSDYNTTGRKYGQNGDHLLRSQSVSSITNVKPDVAILHSSPTKENSDSRISSSEHIPGEEIPANDNNLNGIKQTKSVLKNASSTSSLNKKKVLFDMDAIQMKSLSASPSQSITEKSDGNEKYELGLINLDGDEWDISSIENEPLKEDTKLHISTKASPKIAELKKTIESQLARRNETPSTAIVGGIDIITGPVLRASSMGGSNTSLGSSILDDSESIPPVMNHNSFVKPKTITRKDDSEVDISEFSTEGLFNTKNDNNNF